MGRKQNGENAKCRILHLTEKRNVEKSKILLSIEIEKKTVIVYTRGMAKLFSEKSMVIVKKYGRF
jgi:hypothetical protein